MHPSLSLLLVQLGLAFCDARQTVNKSCEKIQNVIEKNVAANATQAPIVPGTLAIDCLRSMPYDADVGRNFTKELTKYIQFHSTLEVLRDPPNTYKSPPVDILAGLESITNTDFDSQYDFDYAITTLLRSAHDGHLAVTLCSQEIFNFRLSSSEFFSISKDGYETPSIYLGMDLDARKAGQDVAPVSKINGEDVEDFLDKFAGLLNSQDPDARWNRLFPSLAVAAGDDPLAAPGRLIFNGDIWWGTESLQVTFQNGSSLDLPFTAQVKVRAYKSGFASSGKELFQLFCEVPKTSSSSKGGGNGGGGNSSEVSPLENGPKGYPKPTVRDPYNQILGFELGSDTMVMYIPSFMGPKDLENGSTIFANAATEIVNHATSTGRTKFIIDISANTGGSITRGFDLFKLFFPDKFPYSETRFRRSEGSESLARLGSYLNETESQKTGIPILYKSQVKTNLEDGFSSLDEFLGKDTQLGVKVSSAFAEFNFTATSTEESPIRGYGEAEESLNSTRPFDPKNILIIGDGNCVSTCTTFVNLMTNVGGVRSLVFGGRPRNGPMQIMGGVRGAQVGSFVDLIDNMVRTAASTLDGVDDLPDGFMETVQRSWPIGVANFPLQFGGGTVNMRNAYQEGNGDLPLQFEYQAADCRLFYTEENVADPPKAWAAAKEAIWGDGKCVKESTGGKGSRKEQEDRDSKKGTEGSAGGDSSNALPRNGSPLLGLAMAIVVLVIL